MSDPVIPKKKKSKKQKKQKQEVAAVAVEAPVVQKEKKSKKNKKDKKAPAPAPVVAVEVPVKAKKSKKNKKKRTQETESTQVIKKAKVVETTSSSTTVQVSTSDAETKAYREEKQITVENWDQGPMTTFAETGIATSLLSCVSTFERPSPIQSECWAPLLSGRDVIGIAQTGSGKTLGFGVPCIPILQARKNTPGVFMLALAPTRELAIQIDEVLKSAFAPIKTICIYGGGDKYGQIAAVRGGAKVIIATPGRLLSLVREGSVNLSKVVYLVMDEADRMLDMGFEPDIRAIVSNIPTERQTLLFSATWPRSIQKLASEFVRNPVHVTVGNVDSLTSSASVTQIVEVVDDSPWTRQQKLLGLLKKYHDGKNRCLVFVLYKKEVPQLDRFLSGKGFKVAPISSDFKQQDRIAALGDFKSGKRPILIATDVAARGLDIPNVEFVINFSFPLTVEDYIHRIGRTGRGGATGLAHTFFTSANKTLAGELVNVLEDAKTEVPDALRAFGCFTKVKEHSMYGTAFKSGGKPMKPRKRVVF